MRKSILLLSLFFALATALASTKHPTAHAQTTSGVTGSFYNSTLQVFVPPGVTFDDSNALGPNGSIRFGNNAAAFGGDYNAMPPGTFFGYLQVQHGPHASLPVYLAERLGTLGRTEPPLIRPDVSSLGAPGAGTVGFVNLPGQDATAPLAAYVFRAQGSDYLVYLEVVLRPGAGAVIDQFLSGISIAPGLDDYFNALSPTNAPLLAGLPTEQRLLNGGITLFTPPGWATDPAQDTDPNVVFGPAGTDATARLLARVAATGQNRAGYGADLPTALQTFLGDNLNVQADLSPSFRTGSYFDTTYTTVTFDSSTLNSGPTRAGQYFVAVRRVYNVNVFLVGVTPPNATTTAPFEQMFLAMAVDPIIAARNSGTEALVRQLRFYNGGLQMRLPIFWSVNAGEMSNGVVRAGRVPLEGLVAGGYPDGSTLTIQVDVNPGSSLEQARNQYIASAGVAGTPLLSEATVSGVPALVGGGNYPLPNGGQGTTLGYFFRQGDYLVTFAFAFPQAIAAFDTQVYSDLMQTVQLDVAALDAYLR